MRIISGTYRGKQIRPPKNFKARPTTDFAKESLFNILLNKYDFEELDVLDLFAGTGSITYEFISRGARTVLALESEQEHYNFIRKSCQEMEMEMVNVIRGDVFRFLKRPYQSFDIIFADPPYDHPLLEKLPDLVFSTEILAKGGVFILEHPGSHSFTSHDYFLEQRKYGGVNFTFFNFQS
ncbi:MAG: 16S rRNA (guanine(966)-N(2))-methyltransferase RsmD [Bacteroidetes bacterium]|nr:16S rRNA (guanine(966)-N(2))-methyltransferase RsmD [Bacteroidota bacterium]